MKNEKININPNENVNEKTNENVIRNICTNTNENTNLNCTSEDSCVSKTNCICYLCEAPENNNVVTSPLLLPILSNKIFSCYSYKLSQNMFQQSVQFTIEQSADAVYPDNADIIINTVSYSYGSLGITLPQSFVLNGIANDFNADGPPASYCTFSSISGTSTQEVEDAINSANNTLDLLGTVNNQPTIADKVTALTAVANSSTNTNNLAAIAISDIVGDLYPEATRSPLQNAISTITEAILDLTQAAQLVASYLDDTTITTAQAQDVQNYIVQVANLVNQAAQIINTFIPTPPQDVLNLAASAVTAATTAVTQSQQAVSNPSYEGLILPLNQGEFAVRSIVEALGFLAVSQGDNTATAILEALGLGVVAIRRTNLGLLSTRFAINNVSDTALAQQYIDISIEYFTQSADLIITAATFENANSLVPLYDSLISNNLLNICCEDTNTNSIFLQTFTNVDICNLRITVSGTIGCIPFTAYVDFNNLNSLRALGFLDQNVYLNICTPCNKKYNISEKLQSSLCVNCVVPVEKYSSASPLTFTANILSLLVVDFNIYVLTKESLIIAVNNENVPNECELYNSLENFNSIEEKNVMKEGITVENEKSNDFE